MTKRILDLVRLSWLSEKTLRISWHNPKARPTRDFLGYFIPLFTILIVAPVGGESAWAIGKPASNENVQKCQKSGNPDSSIHYCTQAIDSGQLSGKALGFAFYRRANAYNDKGHYDRAIQDYDQAIHLNPNHAGTFSNRGVAYGRSGDYDRAIENYDQALRLNPSHADAFSNRGVAYARKGDYDRAIQDYDQAIRLNPSHTNAFYDRGNAYRRKGDYNRAIDDYDQALRLNPKHVEALSNRGVAYARKGDYDRAIQDYDEAVRLNPNHTNTFVNRGNAYRRKRDYDHAVRDYDQAIRLNPSQINALSGRGLARFYQGQFAAAVPDLSLSVRSAPTHLYRILLLHLARARAGDDARDDLARSVLELNLQEWPGPIVSMYLGKTTEHDVFEAIAETDARKRRERECQAYFYLGQQWLIRRNQAKAAKMFRAAVATNASTLFEYEAAEAELKRLEN